MNVKNIKAYGTEAPEASLGQLDIKRKNQHQIFFFINKI